MKDLTNGKLSEELAFANKINNNSLQECLDRLKLVENNLASTDTIETLISCDFAKYSFCFERFSMPSGKFVGNGGIIFHGKHDNGGDGGAPTFSVCLEPVNGWSIHT